MTSLTPRTARIRLRRPVELVAAILAIGAIASSLGAAETIVLDEWRMKTGDDPAWSLPGHDDSSWESVPFHEVPETGTVIWLRTRVELTPRSFTAGRPLGIYVAAISSHEIYWDGELIGRGGVVGPTPATEVPGPIEAHYVVPERLAAVGPHDVALRVSAHHRRFEPFSGYWVVLVAEYDRLVDSNSPDVRIALISLSGILMVAAFAFLMFAQNREDRSFLVLGFLCLTAALLLVAESYRGLFGYTYDWHIVRLLVVTALAFLLDVLLLVFLARRFPMKGARAFVLAGSTLALVPIFVCRGWDPKAIYGFLAVFALGTIWCAVAAWKRLPGSALALAGVGCGLAFLLWEPTRFLERNLYLSLDVLLLCLLASHVRHVARVRSEREEAIRKSSRLEAELLRKHIQPHFLLNTLTALSEWIEQEPAVATTMIQSLAEEFRILSDIGNRRLITMEDELRLCRSHLTILGLRKDRTYRLESENVRPDAAIPPAVILTLVENAITHNHYPAGSDVVFRLTRESSGGRDRYTFVSPAGSGGLSVSWTEGTGLRYIRARLAESFAAGWSLAHGPSDGAWVTRLEIPTDAREAA